MHFVVKSGPDLLSVVRLGSYPTTESLSGPKAKAQILWCGENSPVQPFFPPQRARIARWGPGFDGTAALRLILCLTPSVLLLISICAGKAKARHDWRAFLSLYFYSIEFEEIPCQRCFWASCLEWMDYSSQTKRMLDMAWALYGGTAEAVIVQ